MILRTFLIFLTFLTFSTSPHAFAQKQDMEESNQQIDDFSVVGFGEKGKKTWDISAKTADIFTDIIKLKDITGNLYGEKEDIKLTADKGDYNKSEGKVHLEKDVVITTSSGAKLTTESLDWDRQNQVVIAKDIVNIERGNIITVAQGAKLKPDTNKVTLEKDVTVHVNPLAADNQPAAAGDVNKTVITCDGPLVIDYEKNIATFNRNVKVERQDVHIYSDAMDIYFLKSGKSDKPGKEISDKTDQGLMLGSKIDRIVARGHVRIMRGENVSYSEEAIYTASDQTITLTGRPRLVIYSTEDLGASSGN